VSPGKRQPPRTEYPADAIVVLGGGVNADGTLPLVARARVDRAVELYHAGIAPRMILSGRCGLTDPEPLVTEAKAMSRYAHEQHVPLDALLLEEEARDTMGNAYFVREMYLAPNGWTSIRVVTSDFHLSRAAYVFRKILGPEYDFSFVSSDSGFSPRELILRALEECKLSIFLNEWLQAVEAGDGHAIDRLMVHDHPGYADAPTLSHEQLANRLHEIAHINQIAGTQRWIEQGEVIAEQVVDPGRRKRTDRRRAPRPRDNRA
jgi:uncharacterized SAM-binding protein YcdF (DUF218 family)